MYAINPLYALQQLALGNLNRLAANAARVADPRWWEEGYDEYMAGLGRVGRDALEVQRQWLHFLAGAAAQANNGEDVARLMVNAAEAGLGIQAGAWNEAMKAAQALNVNGMLQMPPAEMEPEAEKLAA